jgi:tripartite-type tricarboxylate transporter receptor subunit TctC
MSYRAFCFSVLMSLWSGYAAAQATANVYPSRPVTLLVGYAAGTGIDTTARFYADRLRELTGQPVLVINKVGAVGNIAASEVVRASPDGYTLLVTPNSTLTTNPHLLKKMPFDPVKDLTPVAPIGKWGAILLVNPQTTPVKNVQELSAFMKSQPGKLNFGSGNFTGRAAGELYKVRAGIDATHVPYKSVPAALTDLAAGQLNFMFADVLTGLPQARQGKLRALAVTTAKRISVASEIPTMQEAGVSNYELINWFAVFAPAGVPPMITQRITELFNQVTHSSAAVEFYERVGGEPYAGSADALGKLIEADTKEWGRLVKAAGIEPE